MTEKERQKEIKARILRDDPNPISIGNGVHREKSKLATKIAKEKATQRINVEKQNGE